MTHSLTEGLSFGRWSGGPCPVAHYLCGHPPRQLSLSILPLIRPRDLLRSITCFFSTSLPLVSPSVCCITANRYYQSTDTQTLKTVKPLSSCLSKTEPSTRSVKLIKRYCPYKIPEQLAVFFICLVIGFCSLTVISLCLR